MHKNILTLIVLLVVSISFGLAGSSANSSPINAMNEEIIVVMFDYTATAVNMIGVPIYLIIFDDPNGPETLVEQSSWSEIKGLFLPEDSTGNKHD